MQSAGLLNQDASNKYRICGSAIRKYLLEEAAFIQALKEGKPEAYRILVANYGDRVYNTVLNMLQDFQETEDISQEVFMAVYQNIGRFRGDALLSTWIYRISVTKSLEALRKRKPRPSQHEEYPENLSTVSFQHPGLQTENRERGALLFRALKQLPQTQKTAFVLHKTEGLSYSEVAAVMNVTIPAVESLIYRARQTLQKILSSYYKQ